MPTIAANGNDLLDLVKKMPPEEYLTFIEKALALRPSPRSATLSVKETRLIERINRGLPLEMLDRYAHLIARRKKEVLTREELQELLQLTHVAESQDADRAAALLELAKLRRMPVRALMRQMGIQTPAIHG
jgi:hypothetical protein